MTDRQRQCQARLAAERVGRKGERRDRSPCSPLFALAHPPSVAAGDRGFTWEESGENPSVREILIRVRTTTESTCHCLLLPRPWPASPGYWLEARLASGRSRNGETRRRPAGSHRLEGFEAPRRPRQESLEADPPGTSHHCGAGPIRHVSNRARRAEPGDLHPAETGSRRQEIRPGHLVGKIAAPSRMIPPR